jgi:hypothetical protein
MPEDIDKQVGEVVLCTYKNEGDLISSFPIGGGYGDSITFNSLIINRTNVSINYTDWRKDPPTEYTVDLIITEDGKFK